MGDPRPASGDRATTLGDAVPVVDGFFRVLEAGAALLLGGRCGSCGRLDFPRPSVCVYCRSTEVAEVELGVSGAAVWTWTSIVAAPPGYDGPVPFGFGVVELDEGIRVVTRLTEADPTRLSFGDRVRCVTDSVATDADGAPVVAWAFALEESRTGGRDARPGAQTYPQNG